MLKVYSVAAEAVCTSKKRLETVPIFGKRSWCSFHKYKENALLSAFDLTLKNHIISSSLTKSQLSPYKSSSINDDLVGSDNAVS